MARALGEEPATYIEGGAQGGGTATYSELHGDEAAGAHVEAPVGANNPELDAAELLLAPARRLRRGLLVVAAALALAGAIARYLHWF